MTSAATTALPSKQHYEILDGLRGVAAIMVVIFHMFEAFANENRFKQIVNHGYLAVDFFFLLSGFVIAYAYDDRWNRMSTWDFFKRRLIRLQPMVVMGSLVGAVFFYLQRAPMYPLIATTPVWKMLLVMLVGCTLIPLLPSQDIRGWQEMHPLNGPAWSLFFEYVANILYALGLRKLSNKALGLVVFFAGCFLLQYTLFGGRGDVIGGWSITSTQLHIGFVRLLYPFFAGILLQRLRWRLSVPQPFLVCSLMIIAALAVPRFGGPTTLWMNGLYEGFAIIVLFPLIVAIGAGVTELPRSSEGLSRFLGGISYPLYITHYPLIYLYTAWAVGGRIPGIRGVASGALLLLCAITLAYACLKLYDEPVRRWLAARFLHLRT